MKYRIRVCLIMALALTMFGMDFQSRKNAAALEYWSWQPQKTTGQVDVESILNNFIVYDQRDGMTINQNEMEN